VIHYVVEWTAPWWVIPVLLASVLLFVVAIYVAGYLYDRFIR